MNADERISLERYIERIFEEREIARIEAAKVLQAHLDNLNHWKEEAMREREKLVNKEFYNTQHESLSQRVEAVERAQSRLIGIGVALVAVSFLIGLVLNHLLKL